MAREQLQQRHRPVAQLRWTSATERFRRTNLPADARGPFRLGGPHARTLPRFSPTCRGRCRGTRGGARLHRVLRAVSRRHAQARRPRPRGRIAPRRRPAAPAVHVPLTVPRASHPQPKAPQTPRAAPTARDSPQSIGSGSRLRRRCPGPRRVPNRSAARSVAFGCTADPRGGSGGYRCTRQGEGDSSGDAHGVLWGGGREGDSAARQARRTTLLQDSRPVKDKNVTGGWPRGVENDGAVGLCPTGSLHHRSRLAGPSATSLTATPAARPVVAVASRPNAAGHSPRSRASTLVTKPPVGSSATSCRMRSLTSVTRPRRSAAASVAR